MIRRPACLARWSWGGTVSRARRQCELAPTDPGAEGEGAVHLAATLLQRLGSGFCAGGSTSPAHAIAQRVSAGAWWTVIMLIFDSGTTSRSTPG